MTSLSELRFFTTPAHDCSYIEGRDATTLFVDPLAQIDTDLYSSLSGVGFRRSGAHIYRPYCQGCTACIPVRIPVQNFSLKRRQKRVLRRNLDVTVERIPPVNDPALFAMYDRYITARHADGDMYPANQDQFASFLVEGRDEASFFLFRTDEKLLGVSVVDELNDGLSAIYTFFEPTEDDRSPGVLAILLLIEEARRRGLHYLYLGYWIKECQKMNYKVDYKPIELYINNHWVTMVE